MRILDAMIKSKFNVLILVTVLAVLLGTVFAVTRSASDSNRIAVVPSPIVDAPLATAKGTSTAVLAGGCFWGIEAVFEHVKGVTAVTSGYSGGSAKTANYGAVSEGESGHAEAVRIVYDPSQVTYGQLLKVFFAVAHDPTQLNRQGPDTGPQYRSAIFFANAEQERIAAAYIKQLDQGKVFGRPIVTQVVALTDYYAAEDYHQDYAVKHPNDAYIVHHDLPKVAALQKELPELYVK